MGELYSDRAESPDSHCDTNGSNIPKKNIQSALRAGFYLFIIIYSRQTVKQEGDLRGPHLGAEPDSTGFSAQAEYGRDF